MTIPRTNECLKTTKNTKMKSVKQKINSLDFTDFPSNFKSWAILSLSLGTMLGIIGVYFFCSTADYDGKIEKSRRLDAERVRNGVLRLISYFTFNAVVVPSLLYVPVGMLVYLILNTAYVYLLKGVGAYLFIFLAIIAGGLSVSVINGLVIYKIFTTYLYFPTLDNILLSVLLFSGAFFYMMYKIATFIALKKEGVKTVATILNESIRLLFKYPSLIIISYIMTFFGIVLLLSELFLLVMFKRSTHSNFWLLYLMTLILFMQSYYMYNFIAYHFKMLVAKCVAYQYWERDEPEKSVVMKYATNLLKYQSGTITKSVIQSIPICGISYLCKKKKCIKPVKGFGSLLVYTFGRLYLIINTATYAAIYAAMKQCDFEASIQKFEDFIKSRCSLFLVAADLTTTTILVVGQLAAVATALVGISQNTEIFSMISSISQGTANAELADIVFSAAFTISSMCFLLAFVPPLVVATTAVRTVTVCILLDLEENGTESKPYYMCEKLQKVLIKNKSQIF